MYIYNIYIYIYTCSSPHVYRFSPIISGASRRNRASPQSEPYTTTNEGLYMYISTCMCIYSRFTHHAYRICPTASGASRHNCASPQLEPCTTTNRVKRVGKL